MSSDVIIPAAFDFKTKRLRLRLMGPSDEAFYSSLYTDPEIMRFIALPFTAEGAMARFKMIVSRLRQPPFTELPLVMLDKTTLQPVGVCGMLRFDSVAARVEVGMVLSTEAQSRGFAREGLAALVEKAFTELSINEIYVRFSAMNSIAKRLCVSVGFAPCADEARARESLPNRLWTIYRSS